MYSSSKTVRVGGFFKVFGGKDPNELQERIFMICGANETAFWLNLTLLNTAKNNSQYGIGFLSRTQSSFASFIIISSSTRSKMSSRGNGLKTALRSGKSILG